MPAPMQISLDELLSMVMARIDALTVSDENVKTKFNVLARAMYKKGLLTDADIIGALKDEYKLLKDLGLMAEEPDESMIKAAADGILQWIKNDVKALKKSIDEYERRLQELTSQEARKPRIDVASPAVLQQLDKITGGKKKPGGGKLIV